MRSYALDTFRADVKRLEIRTSNLIEEVCDVAPGRDAVSSSYSVCITRQRAAGTSHDVQHSSKLIWTTDCYVKG